MKNLASPSFFRLFELVLDRGNADPTKTAWTYQGIAFERDRQTFTGSKYSFAIDVFRITSSGRRPWSLIVTKEHWWADGNAVPLRGTRWAKLVSGKRSHLMHWLRDMEQTLDAELGKIRRGNVVADGKDE